MTENAPGFTPLVDKRPIRAPSAGAGSKACHTLISKSARRPRTPHRAFTLVELLVVIAIMALLITVLVVAGGGLIDDTKKKDTAGVMQLLEMAMEEFRQDAPLKRVKGYHDRYGDYPCDELEVFARNTSVPGIPGPTSETVVGPPGGLSDINPPGDTGLNAIKHRDIAAMALAIRLYSEEGTAVLDKIGHRYKKTPGGDDFFDRNGNGDLDLEDEPLVYYVDAWGNPIEYFAILPTPPGTPLPQAALTDNMAKDRLNTAQRLVRDNHHKPVLVSYGPDGSDQFDLLDPDFESPLVEDFSDSDPVIGEQTDNPLNADNVYVDKELTAKLKLPEPAGG